ncbi:hypothetical protein BAL199_27376 [alpha proteobacterium BAL199]|jgi:hypothetical protein|nr:hypothetical protein BAL199_27376 [alpha proteobacterium BAL199]
MPQGLENQNLAVDPSVDPIVLAVMLIAFLVGAVGPFVLCVLGSVREERAMRRFAANAKAVEEAQIANPVDSNVLPAALPLQASAMPETLLPANDAAGPVQAVGG